MQQVLVPKASKHTRTLIVLAALAVVVTVLATVVFLALHWPFRREAVLKELADASQSNVDAGTFRGTYFPRPGCVLEHVTFQHNPKAGTPPLITVERIRIESSFSGLFSKHVKRIRADGMRILIPARGSGEEFKTPKRSTFVIDDLIADGATLEIASREAGKQPLSKLQSRGSTCSGTLTWAYSAALPGWSLLPVNSQAYSTASR